MTGPSATDLATLRFWGTRFERHTLDVECTAELVAYRKIVLECAKSLWRRKHTDRQRLPRRFEDGFRLEFERVEPGSASVPIRRVLLDPQESLVDDEFDEAVDLIDAAIDAAARDDLLPEALPPNVIPLFAEFGRSLQSDEVLYVRARRSAREAPYNAQARERLANWVAQVYEDRVEVSGEVRMANLGPGRFTLQVSDAGSPVEGRFAPSQEALVLEALKAHREVRLRVTGLPEFSMSDRQIKRFARVDQVRIEPAHEVIFDASAPAIWDVLAAIGAAAPAGAWDDVPADLSKRIDEVVYGGRERSP